MRIAPVTPCGGSGTRLWPLSLQKHHHPVFGAVVVRGAAEVTRDGEVLTVRENESVYLPLDCAHRIADPGRIPVEIIEVQTGSYLEEDDILRIGDDVGRRSRAAPELLSPSVGTPRQTRRAARRPPTGRVGGRASR